MTWQVLDQADGGVVIEAAVSEAVARLLWRGPCADPSDAAEHVTDPVTLDASSSTEVAQAVLVAIPEPGAGTVEVEALESVPVSLLRGACIGESGSATRPGDQFISFDGNVVRLEDVGWLRNQPLARLTIKPFIGDSDGNFVRVQRVRVRIRYGATPGTAVETDPSFAKAVQRMVVGGLVPPSTRALVEHRTQLAAAAGSRAAASADDPDALRIVVDRDGMAMVTGAQLEAAGWDLGSVDASGLGLESGGVSRSLALEDAGAPGLDPSDWIIFEGHAMTGPYTRENVYWLTKAGIGGTMMQVRDGSPGDAAPATPFTTTLHFEEDTALRYEAPASEGSDRWMWSEGIVAPDARTERLTVFNVSETPGSARLTVALQSGSSTVANPDHHVVLRLNDTVIADTTFDGLGSHTVHAVVPAGVLVEGDNSLSIESPGDTDADIDRVYLNWVDVEYLAGFQAQSDRLTFTCRDPGRRKFRLEGFTSPNIEVYDVTDQAHTVLVSGAVVEGSGSSYSAVFESTCGGLVKFEAVASGAGFSPVRVELNAASNLRDESNGADYVIVVHEDLEAGLADLVASQTAAGRRVKVVQIRDVYDEFSHGVFDPRAIRDFLRHSAADWTAPAPSYALLVGEANLDYRRGYDRGPANYVPSMEIDLRFGGQATSDAWFAALDEDDVLPDLMLGRISATNAGQVRTAVDKTLRFQTVGVTEDWRRRAIIVADDDGAAGLEYTSERLIGLLPPDVATRRFYAGSYPPDQDLTADIQGAINEGAFVLNFAGHGNVDLWSPWPGGGQIFNNNAIAGLTNGDKLPIFTAATCMNGWFAHPLSPTSMSEAWLRHPNGGGVAAWSPTGIAPSIGQEALLYPFYTGLFDGRGQTLGGLVIESMLDAYPKSGQWRDIIQMFVFMGDPSTVPAGASVRPTPTPEPGTPNYLPALTQGANSRR